MWNSLMLLVVVVTLLPGCATTSQSMKESSTGATDPPVLSTHGPDEAHGSASITSSVQWQTVGYSSECRPIEATTIGDGPRRVLIIGGIHGDETEGLTVLPDLTHWLDSDAEVCSTWTIRVLRDINPDGTAHGTRSNARGVDLNRNWPASNFRASSRYGSSACSEPEVEVALSNIDGFHPHLIIVMHSVSYGPFVNIDGPAHHQAAAWVNAANRIVGQGWRIEEQMGYATPGSLGTYVGVDRAIPILTIEFLRGKMTQEYRCAALAGLKAVLNGGAGLGRSPSIPDRNE